MNERRLLTGNLPLAVFAAAAVVATTLLLGGIDRLADHYASGRDTVQVSTPAA